MSIIHEYDIRGIAEKELNEEIFYLLGMAFAELIEKRLDLSSPIVVGRDGRLTSEKYTKSFIKGLTEKGIDIIDIGLCTSPMTYFAIKFLRSGGGAMITASHNPKEYNGIKLCNKESLNLSPKNEAASIAQFLKNPDKTFSAPEGKVTEKNILDDYIKFLTEKTNIGNLKIAADAGNGVAGIPFIPLVKKLGIEMSPLYMKVDGSFPNHLANPAKEETLQDLQELVIKEKCDFGVAFDADADRAQFVDEKGNIIPSDITGCLLAENMLKENPNGKIVYDILCTKALKDLAKEKKAEVSITKNGRHNILNEMKKDSNNILGIEKSGHFYYKDFYYLDNALITFIKVAEIISKAEKPLSNLVKKYQKYFCSPVINIEVKDREKALEKIKSLFSGYDIKEIDGVNLETKEFRFTVRKSNTEPLVRVVIESNTKEKLDEIRKKIEKALEDC